MAKPPGDESNLTNKARKTHRIQRMKDLEPGIERVKVYLDAYTESQKDPEKHDWTSGILPHLSIHSHSSAPPHPQITFLFTVQPEHTNGLGNLHGGCTATVFDLCTSLPLGLVARPGFWLWLGVSRTLNVTYLRPIPAGSVVRVECELQQVGRKMCTVRGVMRMAEGDGKGGPGPALAVCEHGKVNTDPPVEKL